MAESKMSVRDALKLIHPNATERVEATKWWAFAQVIDHALYDGDIADKTKGSRCRTGSASSGSTVRRSSFER